MELTCSTHGVSLLSLETGMSSLSHLCPMTLPWNIAPQTVFPGLWKGSGAARLPIQNLAACLVLRGWQSRNHELHFDRDAVDHLPQEELLREFSWTSDDEFALHSFSKHQWILFCWLWPAPCLPLFLYMFKIFVCWLGRCCVFSQTRVRQYARMNLHFLAQPLDLWNKCISSYSLLWINRISK